MKLNCWEFNECGREPGGSKACEYGVCPAAIEEMLDGANSGINGGRACWAISGTMCNGQVAGTYANKLNNCLDCMFYQIVSKEEGVFYECSRNILTRIA